MTASQGHAAAPGDGSGSCHAGLPALPSPAAGPSPCSPSSVQPTRSSPGARAAPHGAEPSPGVPAAGGGVPLLPGLLPSLASALVPPGPLQESPPPTNVAEN